MVYFFSSFKKTWKFADFYEINRREKSHAMEDNKTRRSSSHYSISLARRSRMNVRFEILHDRFEAMYAAKVISKLTGLRVS